jgi:hypothetical protein
MAGLRKTCNKKQTVRIRQLVEMGCTIEQMQREICVDRKVIQEWVDHYINLAKKKTAKKRTRKPVDKEPETELDVETQDA